MSCGNCTVCCKFFKIDEIKKPANELCKHCTGKGCGIYDNPEKPSACDEFRCAYLDYNWPKALRPDKCGVLVWGKGIGVLKAVKFKKATGGIKKKLKELSSQFELILEKTA